MNLTKKQNSLLSEYGKGGNIQLLPSFKNNEKKYHFRMFADSILGPAFPKSFDLQHDSQSFYIKNPYFPKTFIPSYEDVLLQISYFLGNFDYESIFTYKMLPVKDVKTSISIICSRLNNVGYNKLDLDGGLLEYKLPLSGRLEEHRHVIVPFSSIFPYEDNDPVPNITPKVMEIPVKKSEIENPANTISDINKEALFLETLLENHSNFYKLLLMNSLDDCKEISLMFRSICKWFAHNRIGQLEVEQSYASVNNNTIIVYVNYLNKRYPILIQRKSELTREPSIRVFPPE